MAPEINGLPLIRDQSIPSWKVPDHFWGSDPTRTLLLTSLGWSQKSLWLLLTHSLTASEPGVSGHCLPPFLMVGFFFFAKGGGKIPCLFPTSLHLMCNRLAFAGKAENYKEGLIDPPVSLKKVCLWSLIDPLGTYGTMNESSRNNGGR